MSIGRARAHDPLTERWCGVGVCVCVFVCLCACEAAVVTIVVFSRNIRQLLDLRMSMSSSSPNSPRSRLGRLFHRRGPSDASAGFSPKATAPAAEGAQQQNGASETEHVRRRSSKRSLRDYVQGSGSSRSRSGSRRISLQREQLNRESAYNAPPNLPSGAEVAAAKALYPDGNWAPVSPANGNFPLSGPQAQGGRSHVTQESHAPPIYESPKTRPNTTNSQVNGQTIERMLAQQHQQQQERLVANGHRQTGASQARANLATLGNSVTTTTTTTTRTNLPRRSKDVTGHSPVQHRDRRVGGFEDFPDPLKVTESRTSISNDAARTSPEILQRVSGHLAHKPDVSNLRKSVDSDIGYGVATPIPPRTSSAQHGEEARHIRSLSLQKPLPEPPVQESTSSRAAQQPAHIFNHDPDLIQTHELGIQNSNTPIDVSNIVDLHNTVDLRNTEDITHHTRYAPAVTHETVVVEHHEEIQEIITRETHNHHIFHRILPVIDFEVLPPRHFIETRTGAKYEISSDIVPPGTNDAIQTLIHDAVSTLMPKTRGPAFPTRFSARSFHGTDGDPKEWRGPYGEPRTEQWWVHPPTWETGGRDTGQTEPFHFGSQYEEDDGLRTPLPDDTSKWPQQLKRASMMAPASTRASQAVSVSAGTRPQSARMSQEYQDYQIYQDALEGSQERQAGAGTTSTVLPIWMQHQPRGTFRTGSESKHQRMS